MKDLSKAAAAAVITAVAVSAPMDATAASGKMPDAAATTRKAAAAPGPARTVQVDELAIPADRSFLDDVTGGPDAEAIRAAPVARPQEPPAQPSQGGGTDGAGTANGVSSPDGGDVVIEKMNVTVETAPVEPRTVAPSKMMGTQGLTTPSPEPERPVARPADGAATGHETADGAAGSPDEAEEVLASTIVGWMVYATDGTEVGEVEDLIVNEASGAVNGMLVKVGGVLGTGLGANLVRLAMDEVSLDAADETVCVDADAEDITSRPAYEGHELHP